VTIAHITLNILHHTLANKTVKRNKNTKARDTVQVTQVHMDNDNSTEWKTELSYRHADQCHTCQGLHVLYMHSLQVIIL